MAGCANFRRATLSDTHPLQLILGQVHHKGAQPYPCVISQMSEAFKRKVKGTVMEIDQHLPELTEFFEPVASKAWHDAQLMDRFPDQVIFDDCKGHNFLHLENLNRDALKPTYIKGGVGSSPVGGNLSVAVRLFRCILNHVPMTPRGRLINFHWYGLL